MPIKEIFMLGNPKLRNVAEEEIEFKHEVEEISRDLKDTLHYIQHTRNTGRGIAAPQIGHNKRLIYIDTIDRKLLLINPEIIWKSNETFYVWDTCFSFDMAFYVKVKRFKSVQIKYQNHKREIIIEKFSGSLSELIQHEIDHLNGILAIDLIENKEDIIMASEFQKLIEI
jgi:peptide deformylase